MAGEFGFQFILKWFICTLYKSLTFFEARHLQVPETKGRLAEDEGCAQLCIMQGVPERSFRGDRRVSGWVPECGRGWHGGASQGPGSAMGSQG